LSRALYQQDLSLYNELKRQYRRFLTRRSNVKTSLKIEGMSCEHCVKHVGEALKGIAGVSAVEVSLKDKTAQVEHKGASLDAMKAAVIEAGYEIGLAQ
jgi:copper ion binding protein